LDADKQRRFINVYGQPNMTGAEADELRGLMVSTGAKAAAEAMARSYADKAQRIVEQLVIPVEARQAMLNLVQKVTQRQN
jgi:geranylgeranyl pyrophosphate synthase